MEVDTQRETPAGLLGDLGSTYRVLSASLNRVRRMLWAWDYVRARETVGGLIAEYDMLLSEARTVAKGLDEASKKFAPSALAARAPEETEPGEAVETSDFRKLLDARSHPVAAREVPSFVLSGLADELDRLDRRLRVLDDVERPPVSTEVGGFRYAFMPRPGARIEVRAYRDVPVSLSADFTATRLGEVADAYPIPDEDAEGVLAFRLSYPDAMFEVRLIHGVMIQGTLYPFEGTDRPSAYFEEVIGNLTAP